METRNSRRKQESNFVIQASDEEGITRVEYRLDEDDSKRVFLDLTQVYTKEQRKQFVYSNIPLHDGVNKIEVTVYNESGIAETARVLVNK